MSARKTGSETTNDGTTAMSKLQKVDETSSSLQIARFLILA